MKINRDIKNKLRPLIPIFALTLRKKIKRNNRIKAWKKIGCPIPPPDSLKQFVVENYQKNFGYTILVETGTYLGDMVEAQKSNFKKIYSIELGIDLFEKAKKRFESDKNVKILLGDSGYVLPGVLKEIDEPVIFWLDGHYSGGFTAKGEKECPIFEELDAIFNEKKHDHVLLIDDARCFNGFGDYPSMKKLSEYILNKNDKYKITFETDIIRCVL